MVQISSIKRVYIEKRDGFDIEAKHLCHELKDALGLKDLNGVRILNRYDFTCRSDEEYGKITRLILSEPNVDIIHEDLPVEKKESVLAIEYLPGQYDQRADSAVQCIQILIGDMEAKVKTAKVLLLDGSLTKEDYNRIRNYCINPIDSREASMGKPVSLEEEISEPDEVEILEGFINFCDDTLEAFRIDNGLAMSHDDILMVRSYFKDEEKRDPSVTEIKVIDTYWSDHCRHTTFLTELEEIRFEEGPYKEAIEASFERYLKSRENTGRTNSITLMDLATINAREERLKGNLEDLELSDEINACSIEIEVNVDGKPEKWLLMFKNETHNHPTEVEPFGGAATCLGGAIRDPLSGRSYVYQAMRVTGSGDPRQPMEETLPGKLPQRKITREAARGYSSYGNQVGLATGQVTEIYHQGYIAKRMEVGAVIGAAPKDNVVRLKPVKGDLILLVGGRTGRDGIGGATGSSKAHTEESLAKSGAEVQKGNAPEERKLQRLFRNPQLSRLIKKCNDFGAGGVSVAIGELADSLHIRLDVIPKKYEGLDGTELAISESQERMAVVISPDDLLSFKSHCDMENLEATVVAEVTDTGRLVMEWRGKHILDIKRSFLDMNGAGQKTKVNVISADKNNTTEKSHTFRDGLLEAMQDLNVCSQQGMNHIFDNTVGAATVLMPFGGKYRMTPIEGMCAKIPVLEGETDTCSLMTFGFDPYISQWSTFHGGAFSVVEAVSKIVAMGGDYRKIRLSMQEYFEKPGKDPVKWGKPFSALLGAYTAQTELGIAAIGGKDSMSGSFGEMSVPPTLIAFAVTTDSTKNIISPEFKKQGSNVFLADAQLDKNDLPDFERLKEIYAYVRELVLEGKVLAAKTVSHGGIAASVAKMSFGNKIGFSFEDGYGLDEMFQKKTASIILELDIGEDEDIPKILRPLGVTLREDGLSWCGQTVSISELAEEWQNTLKGVFPLKLDSEGEIITLTSEAKAVPYKGQSIARPRVFIPAFPGTNSEYDSLRAFQRAGAIGTIGVFRNRNADDIKETIKEWTEEIKNSQIMMIPGGFSAGDEPDGSGKFIAAVFRNPYLSEAVMDLIKNRDGLVLGVCNGFQALIKLGLLPYGEIKELDENAPTLTFNRVGRHISQLQSVRVSSKLSPWLAYASVGEVFSLPLSHGEGRFVADELTLADLIKNGQIASQYVDLDGKATNDGTFNANGSLYAVESLSSPDGRILGKMGHSERWSEGIYKNIPGNKDQRLFEAGVDYFK